MEKNNMNETYKQEYEEPQMCVIVLESGSSVLTWSTGDGDDDPLFGIW